MSKKHTAEKKTIHIPRPSLLLKVAAVIIVLIFVFKVELFKTDFVSSVVNGKRVIKEVPEETGFRLLQRVPEVDGVPTIDYEIRLKFSEPISADDFDVTVDKPGFELKKLVVDGQPNTLWILPVKKWIYDLPYNVTVNSTNPDKQLKRPIRIKYVFKRWEGPPPQIFEREAPLQSQTTPSKY